MRYKILNVPNYVKIYPIIYFFFNLSIGIITPIQIIFFRNVGLSLFEIGLISTILEISIVVFEIPTGFIADKLGKSISVACSFICFIIGGIIFLYFQNIYGIALATFVQGIGYTCISGAFEAWGVDQLILNNNKDYTSKLLVSATQTKRIGFLLGSIIGGYIGLELINTAWLSYIILNLVCLLLVAFFMKDAKIQVKNKEAEHKGNTTLSKFFALDSKIIINFIILLGIVSILYEFCMSPIDEYWTVLFTESLKIPDYLLGWIIAIGNMLVILFVSPLVKFLTNKFGSINALKVITIFIVFSVLCLSFLYNPILSILFYILFKFGLGIYEPIQQTYINSIIQSEYRATTLSFYSMLGGIGEIVSGVSIGIIAETTSIRIAFIISAIGFLVISLLFRKLNSINKTHEKEVVQNIDLA